MKMKGDATKKNADVRTLAEMHASDLFEGVTTANKMRVGTPLAVQAARMIHMAYDMRRTDGLTIIY